MCLLVSAVNGCLFVGSILAMVGVLGLGCVSAKFLVCECRVSMVIRGTGFRVYVGAEFLVAEGGWRGW